nr:MAG TPA: minor capsid protein [Caudoviricetes sp.]
MLSPEYYESCADVIVQLYADLENAILKDIIRRLMKTGIITESAKWQAEMLQEAGMLYNDIVKSISEHTEMISSEVQQLFEEAGTETITADNEVFRSAGKELPELLLSESMIQVLEAGYRKTLGRLDNLTSTMPSAGQRMYINACNHAYMKVMSGAFSYSEAIMQAVRDTAASGLKIIRYDSGHTDRIDVAVRRAVLTGVGQTCREIGKMNAEENGCDLMEISAHAGARPDHAVWQGQLVDLTGRRVGEIIDGKRVLSLDDIGYGLITGFGGVNCRHDWYPYFEGYSVPLYTEEYLKKLNARDISYNGEKYTLYEITQMQRKGERKIRDLKRRCVTYEEAVKNASDNSIKAAMQKKYQDSAVKLKTAEKSLKEFCNATNQDRDRFREQVLGFGRSQAQRAVQSNNAHFRNSMKEKGFENPPKSLAKFEEMRYNNPKEYDLMNTYLKSVDTGMMSPLVGYEKYKEYHDRVETELIGITTSNSVTVKSQSKHFLERVFGTIADPSHGNRPRTGVELEEIADALKNGSVRQHKNGSYVYHTSECSVSVNPDTGKLIQVTPRKGKLL